MQLSARRHKLKNPFVPGFMYAFLVVAQTSQAYFYKMRNYMQSKLIIYILFIGLFFGTASRFKPEKPDYLQVSIDLLEAVKDKKSPQAYIDLLAQAKDTELLAQLGDDDARKVFWINVYNAFVQIKLGKEPELFENKGKFFKLEFIQIAGRTISLDVIEHDFLRRSKIKISLGYLSKWFVPKYKKNYRVDQLDYRIHFVLNCGAKSCPEILILRPEKVEAQMEEAAREYLTETTAYNKEENKVAVTPLMSWFRGDFSGKGGVLKILKKHQILEEAEKPKVDYQDYDWTLALGTFKD